MAILRDKVSLGFILAADRLNRWFERAITAPAGDSPKAVQSAPEQGVKPRISGNRNPEKLRKCMIFRKPENMA